MSLLHFSVFDVKQAILSDKRRTRTIRNDLGLSSISKTQEVKGLAEKKAEEDSKVSIVKGLQRSGGHIVATPYSIHNNPDREIDSLES